MKLKNQVAIVTGATKGHWGRHVAEEFVKEGAKVVVYRTDCCPR